MKQSELFSRTIKDAPKNEKSLNAQLLIRAGFIDKLSAGVYSFLPLGLKVLENIEKIISEEIEKIDGQKILMPGLVSKKNWEQTGRWKSFEELFKIKGSGGKEYALAPTHEEVVVPFVQKYIYSYKDLPCYVYQEQVKFRDEIRVKSGLMRTREFKMKDLYSFHISEDDLDKYYEKVKTAYFKIFERMGLKEKVYLTMASGGSFSDFSHEFQVSTSAGEDIIYVCENCKLAINKEIKQDYLKCSECGKEQFREEKAIEVGNIFKLGTKYTEPFNFEFVDKDSSKKLVTMGCYGVGHTRLMGTIVEIYNDKQGIIWPKEVAPFQVHLIALNSRDQAINNKIKKTAEKIYHDLRGRKKEVLYDDRVDKRPGEKFADADLIGIPLRVVISERTLEKDSVEIKERHKQEVRIVKIKDLRVLNNMLS